MMKPTLLLFFSVVSISVLFGETTHVLQRGETLYSLAIRYGVSLDDILQSNSISNPSALLAGVRLIIPEDESESSVASEKTTFHEVVKGDTYYGIARRYKMDVKSLLNLNKRSGDTILNAGDRIKIAVTQINNKNLPTPPPAQNEPVTMLNEVPRWPAKGIKRALDGKLVGISIEAEPMSYVHAVASGNVVWTGPYRGFGHVVLVDSRGYIYLYGGSEDLFVNVGQSVSAGSRIGRLGSSGSNTDKQEVYFSVFREGVPVSPDDAPRG